VDISLAASAVAAGMATPLREALEGLRGLAEASRGVGAWGGLALALAGLAALVVAHRVPRVAAAAGGAAVGALTALAVRSLVTAHLGVSAGTSAVLLAAIGCAGCAALPAAFPAAAFAVPAALFGAHVPVAGRAELGAAVAGLVGGLVGLAAARVVSIVLASLVGGLLLALGLLATFDARPLAAELAARPFALLGFALVTGIAGAAWQLGAPPPLDRAPPRLPED
jgi:hypothetical protein